ncbi:MAG: hypothetical protein MUF54_00430 [Polyangiaceae bacterium]|jgi:hypothetical protein|nr:hypothetical protein [Polyangiaceae bacterium]
MSSATLVAYGLSTLLTPLMLVGVARMGDPEKHVPSRAALLTLSAFLNATVLLWLDCSARALVFVVVVLCLSSLAFPDNMTVGLTRCLGRSRFAVYILTVATDAALLFLYLPITTFLTSPGEIGIHLDYLVKTNARNAMIVVYLAAGLYAFAISPRMRSLLALLGLVSVFLALVYAYGYPFGYPMMNGLMFEQIPIERSQLVLRGLVDAVTVVAATLLALLALIRLGARSIVFGIAVVNVSLAAAAGYRIRLDTAPESSGQGSVASTTRQHPIRFARGKSNVLILFLDRFMGGFVEGILQQEPQLHAELAGFVWYPRTVAAGENSIAGVHPMLGGYDYTPREMNARGRPLRDQSVESFLLLPYNFTQKGYGANLVNPRGLGFTMEGDCSVVDIPGVVCSHVSAAVSKRLAEQHGVPMAVLASSLYADLLSLLGAMRASPYLLRAVLQEKGPWQPFLDHSAGTTFRQWAELRSLPSLSTVEAETSQINVFSSILPHEPYFLGEDCIPQSAKLQVPLEERRNRGHKTAFSFQHFNAARCTLLLVSDYLQWMKQAGVYDDTKIVIVSDHGIVGGVVDLSSRAVAGGTTDSFFVRTRPVLFVKERYAGGSLRISEQFLPNAEVPRIVCEQIGGCVNPYLGNKTVDAHGRNRPFVISFVPWQFNLQDRDKFNVLREVTVEDDPYDATRWHDAPRR